MRVLSAQLSFYFREVTSLKEKRRIKKSIVDKTKHRFNVAIGEVDNQEVHQKLTLGLAVVSADYYHANQSLQTIIHFVEDRVPGELVEVILSEN